MATIYAGPGKITYDSVVMQAEGVNGTINATLNDESDPIAAALHGHVGESAADLTATISMTPFDDWDYLAKLFPAWFGTSVGVTAGVLDIGKDLTATTYKTLTVWTPAGRSIPFVRVALTRPPDMQFGVGLPLFGQATWTAIGDGAKTRDQADFMVDMTNAKDPDSGGAAGTPPDNATEAADIIRGRWTGALGALTGLTAIEAETGFSLTSEVTVQNYQVQKLTRMIRLMSCRFMISCRPVGPTIAELMTQLQGHGLGTRFGYPGTIGGAAIDLVLTGPSSKTVTLKNCDIKGGGFTFGGTTLGIGEVGFVNQMKFTGAASDPLLVFSA